MSPTASDSTEPSARAHLAGADANVAFGVSLVEDHPADPVAVGWAITALFYAALHETRAYLAARHGKHVVAHEDMRPVWGAHPEMGRCRAPYTELKQQSESARYYLNQAFDPADFEHLRARYQSVRSLLRPRTERALREAPAR